MSVEVSSPSVSPKAVATADSRSGVGKGKAGASQGAGDAAPGGFLALLTSFEAPEALASLPSDSASDLPAEVSDGLATPALVPDNNLLTEVPWTELSMLLGQKMPADLAAPSTSKKIAPQAFTAPGDAGLPDLAQQGLAVRNRKAGSADPQSLAAANAAESRALKPTTFMDLVAKEPTLSGALVSTGLSNDAFNSAARPSARPSSGVVTTGLEGAFAQHALSPGGSTEGVSAAAGSVISPESAVAEQVTYWVSQGVQNAQLKLDGFGAEPVEVNISLKGQEAQIDFRTDQPELRQMLEGALTQLKEALAREGLVLSGVSVGASGREGGGAQERRQPPDARQTTVATQEAGSTVDLQRTTPTAGRALDVFV
jgi:flagellar hook-length control protein FliK